MAINSEVVGLLINGTAVPIIDGTFNWNLGGKERTSVMGAGRRLGSTNANMAGSCSFSVAYNTGTDIATTYDVENAQIRVVWDRGNEWLMKRADLTSPPAGSAPDGQIELSYEGDPWIQTK